ncbi:CPBP family intramembrane glutamic endopeptidase [Siminovitchia sediminis]|uniref:CPBP family intramembrane glutamic endopeptidase n=1 Tax=Siminovitchia sediminis TaxID=1274353 RepID=A0ABW4KK81_9BACI
MTLKNHLSTTAGVFYVLLICLFFRILDIFVLKMDEKIGEIIFSKSAGFLLIVLFLAYTGRGLRDIHLNKINLKAGLKLAVLQALLALVLCYGVKFYFLLSNHAEPAFAFNHEYTLITIVLFVFTGNLINTLMEEGLFRGLMLQTLNRKMPFFAANFIQAFIFGLWHIPWTIKDYVTGRIEFGAMVSNSLLYIILSGVMGFIMGYMYYRTKNLWTPIVWHFIWNCTMNLFVIKTMNISESLNQHADVFFWLTFLAYSVISMLITYYFTKKPGSPMQVSKPKVLNGGGL